MSLFFSFISALVAKYLMSLYDVMAGVILNLNAINTGSIFLFICFQVSLENLDSCVPCTTGSPGAGRLLLVLLSLAKLLWFFEP